MGLFDAIRDSVAKRQFERTALGGALKAHIQDYYYKGPILRHLEETRKQKHIRTMLQEVFEACRSPDPLTAIRQKMLGYILNYAPLQVCSLTEENRAKSPLLANHPYISGELHHHIHDAAKHVWELFLFNLNEEPVDNLFYFCSLNTLTFLFDVNAFNLARIAYGGVTQPDWCRPLVEAQLIWSENVVRNDIGLPLTVEDMTEAQVYSSMWDLADDGAVNPFADWRALWPDKYLVGNGPLPQ